MTAEPTPFADYVALQEREPSEARVFPCVPDGKAPLVKDWPHVATNDLTQLRAWANEHPKANVAVVLASTETWVLDVDLKNGGDATLAGLVLANGDLPATLTVRTAGGGLHYYFAGPFPPQTAGRLGPGLDTRTPGKGYVLIPPSVVGDSPYEVIDPSDPAEPPAWLLQLLAAPAREPAKAAPGVELDQPQNVARFTDYLGRHPSVAEGTRNDRTFKAACVGRDLGVSEETALALIDERLDYETPLDPEELAAAVASAYERAENEPGCYALGDIPEEFKRAVAEEAERTPRLVFKPPASAVITPVSLSDLRARIVPDVDELVPGLIERGTVTFLAGPGGVHKSRTAVQVGLCIDGGAPIFGRQPKAATFVYLSYEDHPDEVARRVQTISRRLQLSEGTGHVFDLAARDAPLAVVYESGEVETQPFYEQVRAHLQGVGGHKFVVLDGTYNGLRFAGSAKINEGAVMAGIALLQRLCLETDSTILALWHPSQAGQERGDASGWSVAWHNAPRARLSLSAVKDREDTFELKVEKRNHGPKGQPLTLYWCDGVLLPRTEVAEADREARFLEACIAIATAAAESGAPIRKQNRLNTWMLDEIELVMGRRPAERDVKEALARALRLQRLRYVSHTRHRDAGYYPFDMDQAAELARKAKQLRIVGGTDA